MNGGGMLCHHRWMRRGRTTARCEICGRVEVMDQGTFRLVEADEMGPVRTITAGSPIEPGDRITIDEHGRAHAVPRRHAWTDTAYQACDYCGVHRYPDDGSDPDDDPCPGPRT